MKGLSEPSCKRRMFDSKMQLSQDHRETQGLSQITRDTFISLLQPPRHTVFFLTLLNKKQSSPLNLCYNPHNRYNRSHYGSPPDSRMRGEYLLRSHSRESKVPPTRPAPNQAMSSPPKVTYALSMGSQVLESHCFIYRP